MSHLQIGSLRIRKWFAAVDNFAFNLLLGTTFTDRRIQATFPAERKLVPWHSQPVDINVPFAKAQNAAAATNHINNEPLMTFVIDDTYCKVVVAMAVLLAPYTHTSVLMTSSSSGVGIETHK